MKNYKQWKEEIEPAIGANDEQITPEDQQVLNNSIIQQKINKYTSWLAKELEKDIPNMTPVKKAFIVRHFIQTLGLDMSKVYRILNKMH